MGKASKRKLQRLAGSEAGDAHALIQAEAQRVRDTANFGIRDASTTPALEGLIESARVAIGRAVPTRFMHEGRPYWVRVSVGLARLEVFGGPATGAPLVTGLAGSHDTFGHVPNH